MNANVVRSAALLIVAVMLLNLLSCAREPSTPKALTWDFTKTHSANQIGFGNSTAVYDSTLIKLDQRLCVRMTKDKEFCEYVRLVNAARNRDQLVFISVTLPPETVKQTYAHALRLAATLNVPTEKIRDWLKRAETGDKTSTLAARDSNPSVAIEIFQSFDDKAPWFLLITIGWPNEMPPAKRLGGSKRSEVFDSM